MFTKHPTNFSKGFGNLAMSVVLCLVGLSGCATTQSTGETSDPLEGFNRTSHEFNGALDKYIMKPVADTYVDATHPNFRLTVSNFYDNLNYLNVILNDFLQGKVTQGFADTGRFVVNTTVGAGGMFDAATVFGLEENYEDFGQTLAVWGVGNGPYLDAPLVGPTTGRDLFDQGSSAITNLLAYVDLPVVLVGVTFAAPILVLGVIDKRSRVSSALEARDDAALDTYVFTREAYLQNREFHIHDGDPPTEDLFDELDFISDLEEEEAFEESSELAEQIDKPSLEFFDHQDEPTLSKDSNDPAESDQDFTSSIGEEAQPNLSEHSLSQETPPSFSRKISHTY